ncbi:hypothetical protein J2T07_003782 [Luteibacter jiangsuensis]|uniref:Uncharacterized protein n=1 Tax=Luteibacter jiangsuensis TaxID=637577 RepID=A0ABT9T2U2_9GAMM|nr:hypothetical protein [Luteibacter jiangsuensis]MDQ0011568.1 hypothetical protein [Luteibacter jiangsuensis]
MYKAVLIDCSSCPASRVDKPFPGKFLVNALAETIRTSRTSAWTNADDLSGHEMLRFFVDSPYEQAVAVVWVDPEADYDEANKQAKAYAKDHPGFPQIIESNDVRHFLWASEKDDDLEVARYLRGNTKIRASWFTEVNGLRCLADAQGFAVMADGNGASRAARAAQAHALAIAYQNALYDIANSISMAAKTPGPRAEATLSNVSCFMAAHYFGHPVLPNTRELRDFYGLLRDKQSIAEQFQEAVSQVERLAQVVRESRRDSERQERIAAQDRKELQKELQETRDRKLAGRLNRLNVWVALAGLAVTAAGVTQITPEGLGKWWDAWTGTKAVETTTATPAPLPERGGHTTKIDASKEKPHERGGS